MKSDELHEYNFQFVNDEPDAQRSLRGWATGFVVSGLAGSAAGIAGFCFGGLSFAGIIGGEMSVAGVWLTIASFVLLIVAAHSLDRRREVELTMRKESLRNHLSRDNHRFRTRKL